MLGLCLYLRFPPSVLTGRLKDACMDFLPTPRLFVFRVGRSKTLLTSLVLTVVCGVLVCISPYPTIFIITRFFLAAASSGVYLTLYIIREYFLHAQNHPSKLKRDFISSPLRPGAAGPPRLSCLVYGCLVWQVWSCVNLL